MNKKMDFKAFEEGGMDEFLRGTLAGHSVEPGPRLWKGISRKLLWREITHLNFTNLSARSWIAGAAGALILAAGFYFLPSEKASVTPPAQALPVAVVATSDNPGAVTVAAPATARKNSPAPTVSETHGSNPARHAASARHTEKQNEQSTNPIAYASNLRVLSNNTPAAAPYLTSTSSPGVSVSGSGVLSVEPVAHLTPVEPVATPLLANPQQDTIITLQTPGGLSRIHVGDAASTQFFSANFEITPEMSFYSSPESYSNLNVWANAGISWHFSRFSLSSGLGLGYVYDRGHYDVEYKSNDSVGFYSGVVSYTVGTNNEIIYNTANHSVYDSLLHQDDYRTLNRYAYLQVPLLLGYRLVETPRFGLAFQAGPAVSFLLGERLSQPVIEYENARIVRVDDNTPQRVHTTWQVWGSLVLDYRLSRKVSLYLRPSCKYYLNPVVEQENATFKSPWSAGLGIGVQFNFSPKKKTP
jgi:hypothetical protein